MRVIGIDPGTKCGWSVLDAEGQRIASGVWDLSSKRHEGGGMRFVRARVSMGELLDAFPDAVVGYEEVRRHKGVAAAHVYGGLVSHLQELCESRQLPYTAVWLGTVKKAATGKGNAGKAAMIAAARARWSMEPADDNEADALWVAETLRLEVA